MTTFSWRRWCSSLFGRRVHRPIARRIMNRNRLSFLPLEDRVTPSLTPLKLSDVSPALSDESNVETVGSTFYFTGYDSEHGTELWKSDGTAAGTTLVKDIYPGTYNPYPQYPGYSPDVAFSSSPSNLVDFNGTLFFTARDSSFGWGLWKSDGTESGTAKVTDLWQCYNLTVVNDTLFFVGYTSETGSELWKSDGTAAGTMMVKDIYQGTHIEYVCGYFQCYPYDVVNSSSPQHLTELNGTLYFTAYDSEAGAKLWKSDGTLEGTIQVKDVVAHDLMKADQTLYFGGVDGPGYELWKSDGMESGTDMVKDINAGYGSSFPSNLTDVNGTVYFLASSESGNELWKSDGTAAGTALVKDITPGSEGTWIHGITNVNGQAYFMAKDAASGWWLWKSDGTPSGTEQIKNIPNVNWSAPTQLTESNGILYFTAYDSNTGYQLWTSDGTTTGTTRVSDQSPVDALANFNGQLLYVAHDEQGTSLWTLTDEVLPIASLAIGDSSVSEGNSGTKTMSFTVTLSIPSSDSVTVNYQTANETATAGSDYIATSGTLTFQPGETSKTISVTVLGDGTAEPDETFYVQLSGWTNAVVSDSRATGAILDDDPTMWISNPTVTEGNSGTTAMTFTVTLSRASSETVSVNFSTADYTALAGSDYTARNGTLTFSPGETSKTISILVHGDRVGEYQESFLVNLGNATNATITSVQGLGTIMDDEPRISINDVSRSEGRKGRTMFTFTISLSSAYDQDVTVSYRTLDGSATTSNNDYIDKTGAVTFAAGETTKTISIEVVGDGTREQDEMFYVDLFNNSSNSILDDSQGIGTILNDDSSGGKKGRPRR